MLQFCFGWLGGRTDIDEVPPTTPLPVDPELPPLLPITPSPLPGARLPTGLCDSREDPCTPDWAELKPRIPEPMLPSPDAAPSRSPVNDVSPPTAMLPLPMAPNPLLVVVVLTPPREPGKPELPVPKAAAWA